MFVGGLLFPRLLLKSFAGFTLNTILSFSVLVVFLLLEGQGLSGLKLLGLIIRITLTWWIKLGILSKRLRGSKIILRGLTPLDMSFLKKSSNMNTTIFFFRRKCIGIKNHGSNGWNLVTKIAPFSTPKPSLE